MKLMLDRLPRSLRREENALRQCLEAFDGAMPVRAVYLFGSHARGEAGADSDVDLCIVSEGAGDQFRAAARLRHVMWDIWPRPSFTLVPITPDRLAEKRACRDHFFTTVLREGVQIAAAN